MSENACARPVIRCAIYTLNSTECPTGQDMNSLEGQRAVCSAYIQCQAHTGWVELPHVYDDEGFSGGNLERPALHRLLTDAGRGEKKSLRSVRLAGCLPSRMAALMSGAG